MDKLSKNVKRLIIVGIIVLITYTLCMFVIPFKKTAACWIAYVFSIISIIYCGFLFVYVIEKKDNLKSKVYGLPVLKIGCYCLIAQFVLSIFVYIISQFINVPYWIVLVLSVIILSLALIGSIGADTVRETIEKIDEENIVETKKMSEFRIDASSFVDICDEPTLKKSLMRLAEDFKYSDPVSSDETKDIEEKIKNEFERLRNMIHENNNEKTNEQIEKIKKLLIERNHMCKAFKK